MSSYTPYDNKVYVVKYADDVTIILPIFKNHFDDMSLFHDEISHFENCCRQQQMTINRAKTKIMNINFSSTPLLICSDFDNERVVKVLGLLINDKLTWSFHSDFVLKKGVIKTLCFAYLDDIRPMIIWFRCFTPPSNLF